MNYNCDICNINFTTKRRLNSHVDTEKHAYDFGYGLNWKGVINDARKAKYVPKKK